MEEDRSRETAGSGLYRGRRAELPEELKTEIEARKAEDFKMTYLLDDASVYCARFRNAGDRRLQHTGAGIVSGRKCNLF